MADARAKAVMRELVDLYSRARYAVDLLTDVGAPLGKGDTLDIPHLGSLTVASTGASDVTAQDGTPSVATLTADKDPAIFVELPHVTRTQLMDSAWASALAPQVMDQLKNHVDNEIVRDYCIQTLCYDSSATYHDNVAGDALTEDDLLNGIAKLKGSTDGSKNLALFMSPYGSASMMSIAGFVPNFREAEMGNLGIPQIGSVFGVPVFETNACPSGRTVAATASSITSNVITITVAAGHGVVPGQKITTSGGTADITTAAAVTSVTATTIVAPLTACNDASNGALTVTIECAENLLLDRNKVFAAQQRVPFLREVQQEARTGDVLQATTIYGRIGIAGHARVLCSPKDSA